jgi:predicted RNA binding protein YcfA (HicA-like mRNA interferase family)
MNYPPNIWNQLKNLTVDEIVKALEKSGWIRDEGAGNIYVYLHPVTRKRVTIHYHPKKTYGAHLLKGLLADIGWSTTELRQLKLVK